MKLKKEKRIAAKLMMHWVNEAENDLDSSYFQKLPRKKRKRIQSHIRRYKQMIRILLRYL